MEKGKKENPMMKRGAVRICSLLWADILVGFALFDMQNYLTQVWKLSLTHAAGILNIWGGLSKVLAPPFLCLADFIWGNFIMLVFSSTFYTIGILLVTLSTPPALADLSGMCKQYDPQCISHKHKALFYAGMAMIAVGVASNLASIEPFLHEQEEIKDGGRRKCLKLLGAIVVVVAAIAGAIALPYIKPWFIRFMIPTICTGVASLFFFSGLICWRYEIKSAQGRSRFDISCGLFAVPILLTFAVCGIVSSIGNTYFVEQANHLNRHLGSWNVPLQVLLLFFKVIRKVIDWLLGEVKTPVLVIAGAMVSAVLCCVSAALVEKKRLNVVKRHGLMDKPDDDIPMSMYWLLIQFFFLALLDLFFEKGVTAFFAQRRDGESDGNNLEILTNAVSGVGYMCGVLSVFVVGRISEGGGKENWFQDTLNKSHLERYYWVLAGLSSVSLVVFILLALCYRCIRV